MQYDKLYHYVSASKNYTKEYTSKTTSKCILCNFLYQLLKILKNVFVIQPSLINFGTFVVVIMSVTWQIVKTHYGILKLHKNNNILEYIFFMKIIVWMVR